LNIFNAEQSVGKKTAKNLRGLLFAAPVYTIGLNSSHKISNTNLRWINYQRRLPTLHISSSFCRTL